MSQRTVGKTLDRDADETHDDHREGEDDDQQADQDDRVVDRALDAERGQEPEGHERANHEDVAVGEVDQLDDAVNHCVAKGNERVHRPDGQAVQELLQQDTGVHGYSMVRLGGRR